MQEPLFAMALHTTFLEDLAADLYAKHSAQLHELTIVLPNPRAGSVFKRHLATHLSQPVWAPQVLSLKRFLQEHSPLHPARPLVLTHALYQTFQALQPQEEPLERFYAWGHRLLQDFDVIDTYLINATHLFANLREQKALSLALDYLTEAQRAAIQSFWKNFEQRLSTHQQRFLRLWKQLPQVYEAFRKRLQTQGIGYPGLCQRMAYEALLQGTAPAPYQRLVFAGFNALTPVEEQVLAWYQAHRPTAFYWDVDAYYLEDERQEAGTYLRAHQHKPYFQQSFVKPFPRRLEQVNEKIKVIAVAAEVGQAQIIGEQLQALMERQGPDFVPHKTAIVVADESLLLPVLHALPLDMNQVSTTLRYPLNATATYRLLVHLIALQIAATQDNLPQDHLVMSQVLTVLKHPHVMSWNPSTVQATRYSLQKTSSSHVSRATLTQENALYATLFQTLGPQDSLITYLKEVLQTLQSLLQDARVSLIPLEKKALAELLGHLDLLQEVVDPTLRQGADFAQLLQQLVQPIKIALGYNNVDGVQVVDIFSTQNLDFEQVFIVGMNEGNFPANPSTDSLLPYNLRKGYGLPLMDQHQAALYAYHFYRLLQRAQHVCITYSTATSQGSTGEMSRYLWQLQYEAQPALQKHFATSPIALTTAHPIVIPKTARILQQLKLQPDGTVRPWTPSALNTYLDCSLRFYFQYIAQLQATPSPQPATDALVFGNLLHTVMEKLYTPLLRQTALLQPQDFNQLQKAVVPTVQRVFMRTFQQGKQQVASVQGDQAIAQAIVTKMVRRMLTLDKAYAPFAIVGVELGRQTPLWLDFALDATTQVRLRGIIDRVDWKAEKFRVLDYKTGLDNKKLTSIASLFDREEPQRNKAAFQAFFYAWLFQQQGQHHLPAFVPKAATVTHCNAMPGLLNVRQLFDDQFDPRFYVQRPGSRQTMPIEAVKDYQEPWEEGLRQTLSDLLDPEVPFVQTKDEKRCTSCPYKRICQRY